MHPRTPRLPYRTLRIRQPHRIPQLLPAQTTPRIPPLFFFNYTPTTELSPLALRAALPISSTPTLVPAANIVLGGSGANRTVTMTPALNQSGTATIPVTVSDGSLTASDSFVLTANASPYTAPTISNIAHQTTTQNTATAASSDNPTYSATFFF